ncbi:probable ATP-dependent RNA helicase DDX58 isoform X2 [Hypomesus transpacificus]|uniref:probable ATP-dependent RNA helicase DDX58 isoform X2 n=1 Tax=Hypomesus transpacificus TaxID=137520 RepID=UPI001F07D774|nr:probable ATP-dependent RNA helicase DDX58 isoform X2 [Hypomesus transpacificus]
MYETEKNNLRLFNNHIVAILRPSYITEFMNTYLSAECVERILSEEVSSVTTAAERLLQSVCELETQGWFQGFKDTLSASGYHGLSRALREWDFGPLESLVEARALLDRVEPGLTSHIKPSDLVPHLVPCLLPRQGEEIRAVEAQRGCTAAGRCLIGCLKRSDCDTWFKQLKMALEECEFTLALSQLAGHAESAGDVDDDAMETEDGKLGETMTTVSIQYRGGSEDEEDEGAPPERLPQAPPPSPGEAGVSSGQGQCGGGGGGGAGGGGEKKLRMYQAELAEHAKRGENTIICAPTGCGKTVVALEICEHHLKVKGEGAKVVFMATKVDVYEQQYKLFQQHFQHKNPDIRVTGQCGYQDAVNMQLVLDSHDVIVLTPQILVNALARGELPSLASFSLLILDECHNTTGKHPYNVLMASYLDTKLSSGGPPLPQVVGLTASLGVGVFRDLEGAQSNILQLCSSLDVQHISTVHTHTEELRSHVYTPEKGTGHVSPPPPDSLSNIVNRDYGSQKYEQWIVEVQNKCRVLRMKEDEEEERRVCRALYNYTEHLRTYNDALIINEDARTQDALDFLSAFIEDKRNAGNDIIERDLTNLFDGQLVHLSTLASGGQSENPKLMELQFILLEAHRHDQNTRTVLFVQTRALAHAMKRWIEETKNLSFLQPLVLIGRGRKNQLTGSVHMTLTSMKGVLEKFKSSTNESRLLIATSVADEGVDIPQCNLVLMYEYVGNVVKMVQVRGRGRAQGSRCYLVTSQKERVEKEKLNMQKEKLVEQAVRNLQNTPPDTLRNKVEAFQRHARAVREQERRPERERTSGSFQLLCSKCKIPACYLEDVRILMKAHHIVVDPSLFSRARVQPHPKPKTYDGVNMNKKLFCGAQGCRHDWGVLATCFNIQNLPVIKVDSFVVKNCVTGQQHYYRKWKDVPVAMAPFEVTEMPDNWGPLPEEQSAP